MAASIALSDKPVKRSSLGRWSRRLAAIGAGIAALWLLGIGWFLYLASQEPQMPPHVDAIVVLTGGPDRVEVALRLLLDGAADRLLVSGAGEKTDLPALAHLAGIDPNSVEDQITLGHAAHSTRGNAQETAAWVREHGTSSVLLVTAWFHMPRAMIELRRTMPSVTVHPYPVGRLDAEELTRAGMARRLIGEYHKYLAALSGLTVVWGTE
jgi:uncharacterized SAM-binding protein YcdF (DUF218 family)